MIGVEEAKRIILAMAKPLPGESVPLSEAGHRFTRAPVIAPCDHPLFDMSAVDGYAFAFHADVREWTLKGTIAAGQSLPHELRKGECTRIFTGAMIPGGADTVVMQEFATRDGDRIRHSDTALRKGANVRKCGEQFKKGDVILAEGSALGPQAVGLLASLGITNVATAVRPVVAVLVTGGEFIEGGGTVAGKVHSSNDHMLASALALGGVKRKVHRVTDHREALGNAIKAGLDEAHVVITTGGASVGDHDLVEAVLEEMGATIHFHGVSQKPGKPMLFATLQGKPVFGLPGNPRAVMVLFWEYVRPFLRAMQGARDPGPKSDVLPLTHAMTVKGGRAEFRAAKVKGGRVTLPADEGSHMLRSLIDADALAYLPAGQRSWAEGDTVEVHYIPT